MPTTYQVSSEGRTRYLLVGGGLGCLGLLLISALFSEQAKAQNHSWPVFVFAGTVIALWLGYSGYCMARGLSSGARVVVGPQGFSYEGLLKSHHFPWPRVASVRWIYDRGGFEWFEVSIHVANGELQPVKLDFTGLRPSRVEFLQEMRSFAPSVEVKC